MIHPSSAETAQAEPSASVLDEWYVQLRGPASLTSEEVSEMCAIVDAALRSTVARSAAAFRDYRDVRIDLD